MAKVQVIFYSMYGHIYRLAVHPDYQRRGIAGRLGREIEARLRARGALRIYALRCEPSSQAK